MNLTTDDLITRFRQEVDDIIRGTGDGADNDALWSNDECLYYLNEAVNQTATETLSLFKTFTIAFQAANGPYIKLPSSYEILDINEIYMQGRRATLFEHNLVDGMRHTDDYGMRGSSYGSWEHATGLPTRFTRDFKEGYIRLYPAPTEDDILQITAVIGAVELQYGMPMPFQNPKDLRLVMAWMKHLAYGKKDADVFDQGAADRYESWFNTHALDRKYEAQRLRRAPSRTQFSW